jgi:hypothetical protein
MQSLGWAIEGDLSDKDEIIVTGEHEGRGYYSSLHFNGSLNDLHSKCRAVEEARDAERTRAQLLAPHSCKGFEKPVRSGLRRQYPLATDHSEHANHRDHCVFEHPRVRSRRQVCRQAGLWVLRTHRL